MTKKLSGGDIFKGVLLLFALVVIPLISRRAIVDVSQYEYGIIRSAKQIADIFSYNKSVAISFTGVILLITLLMDIFVDGKKVNFKKACYILAGIFFVLNLLSAVFSPYKHIAFNGISERYEGFWVILGYITFFMGTMIYTDNKPKLQLMLYGLAVAGFLVGLIGVFQYFGIDIFKTELGNKLVLGDLYQENGTKLSIKFGSVYSTLYNPNCAGMYMGMLFPVSAVMTAVLPLNNKLKYVFGTTTVVTLISLIGCDSVGGLLGAGCGLVFVVIAGLIYSIKTKYKKGIIGISVSIIVLAVAGVGLVDSGARIVEKLNIIISALQNPEIIGNNNFYQDMAVEGEKAFIYTKNGIITMDFSSETPVLYQNDNKVEITPSEENIYIYAVEGVEEVKLTMVNNIYSFGMTDALGNTTSFLFNNENGVVSALDKFGTPVDISEPAKSVGFEGMERLGSNRGYIWSRSIPLLLENIIIGKGPDTFSLEFPQDDVSGKLEFLGNPYVIVDKPHNLYLQIGVNSGVLSLVVFLCLIIVYVVNTLKAVFSCNNFSLTGARLAILSGVIGYLVAGMTTDSVVSVSPVFWILLGLGFAINSIDLKTLEEKYE